MITSENERSFQIKLIGWFNKILSHAKHIATEADGEIGVKVGERTKFPDVILWSNKAQEIAAATIELKDTNTPVDDPVLLNNGIPKAKSLQAKYFVTWNVRQTILWDISGDKPEPLQVYPPLLTVRSIEDINIAQVQDQLYERAKEIISDLDDLIFIGKLHPHRLDPVTFANTLHHAVDVLTPGIKKSLSQKYATDKEFKKGFQLWAREQGIVEYDREEFFTNAARQVIYRMLGRVLFYFALRRFSPDLPELSLPDADLEEAQEVLGKAFERVKEIDYQAIFESDITDQIPWDADSAKILQRLFGHLAYYNFSHIALDVIGAVFENLIPPDERHAWGQFFTREDLVDFINGFVVRSKDDVVFDPTCGTGTFLVRAYYRFSSLLNVKDHAALLERLWGNDIASFPTELASINLYTRKMEDPNNYPRILTHDFFKLRPGQEVEFPHPRKGLDPEFKIHIPIPQFDSMMGNFPYIRQELIEKVNKGHKKFLGKLLASEWLREFPDLFEKFPKRSQQALQHWLENGAKPEDAGKLFEEARIKLSGQADIYAYMFFHAARFLKPKGRMAFLTSNSWLDVAYGYELERFFTSKFRIIAIIESRCEPWFPEAAVNTIITVLERADDSKYLAEHPVRFVKIKKPLRELLGTDATREHLNRHLTVDKLVTLIESERFMGKQIAKDVHSYEDENFRIRTVWQGELRRQLEDTGKAVKWGKFLRAPDVYFELMEKIGEKLVQLSKVAEVRRGYTTGINEFFYLTEEKAKQYGIEDEYLVPVVKSPKEIEGLVVDPEKLKYRLFLCNRSKEELRALGHKGALRYIEKVGEKGATKDGVRWSEVPTVQGRKYWWSLPDIQAQVLWVVAYGDKFSTPYSLEPLYIDKRQYSVFSDSIEPPLALAAMLNSILVYLQIEAEIGHVNLGDGAIFSNVVDLMEFLKVPAKGLGKNVEQKFENLLSREILSVFKEVKHKDRQALDSAILESLGLNPDKWLPRIYQGITELVKERLQLPKMRKNQREKRKARSTTQVIDDLVKDFETGIRTFPKEFMPLKTKTHMLDLPPKPFERLVEKGMFTYLEAGGHQYDFNSLHEAKFAFYAQKPGVYVVKAPTDPVILAKVVKEYEVWAKELYDKVFEKTMGRVNDYAQAKRITEQVMEKLGVRILH